MDPEIQTVSFDDAPAPAATATATADASVATPPAPDAGVAAPAGSEAERQMRESFVGSDLSDDVLAGIFGDPDAARAIDAEAPGPAPGAAPEAEAEPAPEAAADVPPDPAPEPAPEPEAPAIDVAAEIRKAIPGAPVSTADEIVPYVEGLAQKAEGMEVVREIASADPRFAAYLQAYAETGDADLAAMRAFADVSAAPDPEEDPAGYTKWAQADAERKAAAKYASQQAEAEKSATAALAKQSRAAFDGFAARMASQTNPDGTPFDAERFAAEVQTLIAGDTTTGRFRGDTPDILYRGLHHDALVASAVAEARASERKTVLAEIAARAGGATAEPADLPPTAGHTGAAPASRYDPSTAGPNERLVHDLGELAREERGANPWGTHVPVPGFR